MMIDATYAKAHRTASSLAIQKGARPTDRAHEGRPELQTAHPGRCKGSPDSHVPLGGPDLGLDRGAGAPVVHPTGLGAFGDRGYDADWFRNALIDIAISPCIPSRIGPKVPIPHDADLYHLRHRIENMFARLKDWRRIATRYDRCTILFLSACALAATVIYWL